jgi:hypothetical protein
MAASRPERSATSKNVGIVARPITAWTGIDSIDEIALIELFFRSCFLNLRSQATAIDKRWIDRTTEPLDHPPLKALIGIAPRVRPFTAASKNQSTGYGVDGEPVGLG